MCAINGINWSGEEIVTKMNLESAHRGPDATGVYCDQDISLGHNRLSIIEISQASNQPMYSTDDNLVIVFNGELYNFREIKQEIGGGYNFKTNSDTEVILAAYEKWGPNMLERFNGIFAFAIWDKRKKELFIARDSIGVKPLYYFWDGTKFIFSSEVKSILKSGLPARLNKEVLPDYLNLLYVPGPNTMFDGINKFPQSHYAILRNKNLKFGKYSVKSEIDKDKNVVDIVREAVERQMVSDRPLGLYLSGGLDSTIILEAMANIGGGVKSYSVGFSLDKDEEPEKYNADFYLARETAKHFGTDHHEVLINKDQVLPALVKSIWHLDEPVSTATTIPMILLSEMAKNSVDVVLAGDGGDEVFGGYERYRLSRVIDYYRKLPGSARDLLSKTNIGNKLNTMPGIPRLERFMFQDRGILKEVVDKKVNFEKTISHLEMINLFSHDGNPTEELMNADLQTWLVDEALLRSDKLSMANALEVRVPLLDNKVVNFAKNLPINEKVTTRIKKKIIREFYSGLVPDNIIRQPKRGWFSPGAKWLRDESISSEVLSIIMDSNLYFLNKDGFQRIFNDHVTMKRYNFNTIWSILTIALWKETFNVKF